VKVDLRALKDSPVRDFRVDPIDNAAVEALRVSITENGFWGGVVCRKVGRDIQIGAGHHRVRAAIQAARTEAEFFADLFVSTTMNDTDMIRVYAMENATQRGASPTALTGSIASAIRALSKAILISRECWVQLNPALFNDHSFNAARACMISEKGIGNRVVVRFLHNIPGINYMVVKQQIGALKDSGEYARIILEIKNEIEAESHDEEVRTRARQAVEAADGRERVFDREGVAQHLENSSQIDTFRQLVIATSGDNQPRTAVVPVAEQAQLAADIAREARARQATRGRREGELSSDFIRERLSTMAHEARIVQNRLDRHEHHVDRQDNWELQLMEKQQEFVRAVDRAAVAAKELVEFERQRPSGSILRRILEFSGALRTCKKLGQFADRLGGDPTAIARW
jgi:ParB-like nuclease domain